MRQSYLRQLGFQEKTVYAIRGISVCCMRNILLKVFYLSSFAVVIDKEQENSK